MGKKKRFKLPEDIGRGMTEVIDIVENNKDGSFRYNVMSLFRIEVDPDNPRELALTDIDIKNGISDDDPKRERKRKEKSSLESLAQTIKKNGIINPIVVYKNDDKYRIVAGERRFLASLLVGKNDIHVKIIDKKPEGFDLKLLQWVENNEREDLSLEEKIRNIEAIICEYNKNDLQQNITSDVLRDITGISRTQAANYLLIIRGSKDIREKIEKGSINSLDKAVLISSVKGMELRNNLITACLNGESIKGLKEIIKKGKERTKEQQTKVLTKTRGVTSKYINLGRTKNIEGIKSLLDIVLCHEKYNKHRSLFSDIDWEKNSSISTAFQELLKILEE